MKEKLKQAVSQQQEAHRAQKAALSAESAGHLGQASAFHVEATFHSADAIAQLQAATLLSIVVGEVVPSEADLAHNRGGWAVRDTLATPDTPALAASLARTEMLAQSRLD